MLLSLTAGGDSEVLERLRERALPALIDMAHWKNPGHSEGGYFLLGRVVGLSEEEIAEKWGSGDRERLIAEIAGAQPLPRR